ncbi:MAG: addiction module protein [Nitrospirae bacterium]|nr:MAG: addiction module protein [Nitrospirota bacterium]
MKIKELSDIMKLSVYERLLLVEDLWDSICEQESEIEVKQEHIKEIEKRLNRALLKPEGLLTMDELKQRLESKK